MEDIGYIWNQKKYDKICQKRGIYFYEVVSALENEDFIETPHEFHEDRFLIIAYTKTNRLLVIVVSEEALPIYRIITAYEAEGELLNEYKKEYPR